MDAYAPVSCSYVMDSLRWLLSDLVAASAMACAFRPSSSEGAMTVSCPSARTKWSRAAA